MDRLVTLTDTDMTQIQVNLIAQQGLYYQYGDGSYNLTVNYEIQYQKVVSGTPTGSIYTSSGSMSGQSPSQVAKTIEITTGWIGATRVRVRRSNNHDFGYAGNVVDEVKYESLSRSPWYSGLAYMRPFGVTWQLPLGKIS